MPPPDAAGPTLRAGEARPAGPVTHYELFAGLRDAGVAYLVAGATALVLHGVPRLTPDVDLLVDPDPANLARLARLLAAWGYGERGGEAPPGEGAAVRRFRHPTAALEELDVVAVAAPEFARLQAQAASAALVDVAIPLVGADDLRDRKEQEAGGAGRDDAAGLVALAAIRAGDDGGDDETRLAQIRKFSRWSVAARLDWLLATARLAKGLSPDAKPMTRGLQRRRPWTERRR
jgi:hypothetical protein